MLSGRRVARTCAVALAASQWLTAAGPAQAEKDSPTALHAGSLVEREIAPGTLHRYDLGLAAGQFADLTVTDDITLRNVAPPEALEVTLRGSSGDPVRRVARETASNGARRLCIVVEHTDQYVVTIAATSLQRYTLRVADVRAATDADRRRSQALADFVEAEHLRAQHSTARDREAIPRYADAASLWTQAGDRLEAAHAWHRLALVSAAVSDWPHALEADERAAALGRELGDLRIEASALNGIGITKIRLGNLPEALRGFERALALFAEAGDRDSEAYTLSGIGVIYQLMGDPDKALQYFPRAMANWKAVGNREGEALGLHVTGTALRLAGRFDEAMPVLEESLRIRRALGHRVFVAATLAQIGHIHLSRSEIGRAFRAYEEALSIQRAIGEWRLDSVGNAALGDIAERGDWPAMMQLFSAGASIFQASAERAFEARILHAPVRVTATPEDLRRGVNVLTAARPFLRAASSGRWGAVVDTAIANILVALGEPDRALDIYPDALATFRAIRDRDGEAAALAGLALAETFALRLVDARDHAAAAVRVIESFQADVVNQELRALYISGNRAIYALYIALEMELDRREPGRGHHLAALLASERARARGLLDLLHTARLNITAGVDAQLLARERQLMSAVEQADDRLTRLLAAKAKPDVVQAGERELDGLTAELRDAQRLLQVQSPQYAALTQPPALDVAGIQRLLDADSVLLEYSLGTRRSYVWVVTPESVTSAVLPGRAEIEQAARRAYELVARGARRDTRLQTRRALESLADLVLAPVAPLLTRRRVIVVPDAGLHYVPFAALPKPDGSRASSSAEPLIVHHEVVVLPSASALDALRKMDRSQAPAPREVAVFADPVLRRDDPRLPAAAAARPRAGTRAAAAPAATPATDEALTGLERLPFTRAEANAIASLTPGDRTLKALDFSASRATALAELGSARIVHFATHALINSEQPDRSGIVLSLVDPAGADVDGFLRLHDIYNLRLNADLVVLSACRTALGKEMRGEGLIGLTRGFFYAGAPAVVASLWDVRDRSTSELMTRFYRAMLRDRLAPAAALRAAQVSMLRDPRWSAPAHWSGFILRGDWRENRR